MTKSIRGLAREAFKFPDAIVRDVWLPAIERFAALHRASILQELANRERMLTDEELADPQYMKAYVEGCNETIAELLTANKNSRQKLIEELTGEMPEPVGFMWQHDETGRVGFAEESQRQPWRKGNPRLAIVCDIYTADQMREYAAGLVAKAIAKERTENFRVAAEQLSQAVAAARLQGAEEERKKWQDNLHANVEYCPTCCEGKIASPDMTRDEVIFHCGKTSGRLQGERSRDAEIAELNAALVVANSNHEEFERKWYLETDRTEKLEAALVVAREALKDCRKELYEWMRDYGQDISTQGAMAKAKFAIAAIAAAEAANDQEAK